MLLQTQKFTPRVYYEQSRDFQLLGRLFDVVMNSVKANAEMLYSLPLSQNSDERLLELMSLTLGFKARHEYNNQQLKAFCSVFPYVLKHKGSLEAFQALVNALANAEGLNDSSVNVSIDEDNKTIIFQLPKTFKGKTLLRDVLAYILPAGMRVAYKTRSRLQITVPTTEVAVDTAAPLQISVDNEIWQLSQVVTGSDAYTPVNELTGDDMKELNIGNIRYAQVIDDIGVFTIEPSTSLEFGADYVASNGAADANATVELFNALTSTGFEKVNKNPQENINE